MTDDSDPRALNPQERLLHHLSQDSGRIADAIVAQARSELAAYTEFDVTLLQPEFAVQMTALLKCVHEGGLGAADVAELERIGEQRAHDGIPLEEMLRAWRIGLQVLVNEAALISEREQIAPEATLASVQAMLRWSDIAMVTTATAHRNAELELARQDEEQRGALVNALLFGTLPLAQLRSKMLAYGLDPTRNYVAIHASPGADVTRRELDAALGFLDTAMHRPGLRVITADGDLAGFLRDTPRASIPGTVGVGPPRAIEELPESFRLATRSFQCARAYRRTGVFALEDLGVLPSIREDLDVSDGLRRRYVDPLGHGQSAAELLTTLHTYFACSMSVDRAAERLFVHANTVRYRINRYEELTGASLRDFATAVEAWWAIEHSQLIARE